MFSNLTWKNIPPPPFSAALQIGFNMCFSYSFPEIDTEELIWSFPSNRLTFSFNLKSTITIETLEKGVKYNQSYNEDTRTTPVTWSCFFILNLNLNFEL